MLGEPQWPILDFRGVITIFFATSSNFLLSPIHATTHSPNSILHKMDDRMPQKMLIVEAQGPISIVVDVLDE